MQRDLQALEEREFDLVIVGCGIFGACAAWDATQRGLSVAIIDRGDFSSATSANSFKLIHGGIRYLQHGNVSRVRESANARRTFLRIAPHLAQPLPIVVPTYGHGMKGKEVMRVAMGIYDAVTFDRNQGIRDPQRRIPRSQCLSRDEVIDQYPGIQTNGLTGAARFFDGQMYNPPRLVLAFLLTAAEHGAVVANYLEATRFVVQGNRVEGIEAKDVQTGNSLLIRSKVVLNATGPYAEGLLEGSLGRSLTPRTPWSRDAYFVVTKSLVRGNAALALPAVTEDPEAVLSRGQRHLFLVPWHGYTLVGVWHKVYEGHPDAYDVTEEELEEWIAEVNMAYPPLRLVLDDVALVNAGLILFGENTQDTPHLKFAHRSRLVDHEMERGVEGCITLIGVRFTTGPSEAVEAIDLTFRKLGYDPPASQLSQTPLKGGDIDDFEALIQRVSTEWPKPISLDTVRSVVHNYGSEIPQIMGLVRNREHLADCLDSTNVMEAQVIHAVREEMAQRLSDVVFRRTDLGTAQNPGLSALQSCAGLMATELGWDTYRMCQEVEEVLRRFPSHLRARDKTSESARIQNGQREWSESPITSLLV